MNKLISLISFYDNKFIGTLVQNSQKLFGVSVPNRHFKINLNCHKNILGYVELQTTISEI